MRPYPDTFRACWRGHAGHCSHGPLTTVAGMLSTRCGKLCEFFLELLSWVTSCMVLLQIQRPRVECERGRNKETHCRHDLQIFAKDTTLVPDRSRLTCQMWK
jgi:hypothetical protein